MSYGYDTILKKARMIKQGVEKEYKIVRSPTWSYYIAKQILNPKKDVPKITINDAPNSNGDGFSRQVIQSQYLDMAKRLTAFVESKHKLPNNIKLGGKVMKVRDYTYMFSRILIYYDEHKTLPKYANVNTKCWIKPSENENEVYKYFVKTFGKISCIDDALDKISGRGYGYYYDDKYSNKQSIDRMKNRQGVNCTDSCHVFYNIGLQFVKQGRYKKVECLHIKCRGGDGHVRLRFTTNNGETFYRDPACTLSDGGYCNWCLDGTLLAVNPSWFMQNLQR